jgi:hypothetical protein
MGSEEFKIERSHRIEDSEAQLSLQLVQFEITGMSTYIFSALTGKNSS